MTRVWCLALMVMASWQPIQAVSADEKALAAERRAAHQERQRERNERGKRNREALTQFRHYANALKQTYRERLSELDAEFRLQQTELDAEREAEIAGAEAEIQQSITQLFLRPAGEADQNSMEQLRETFNTYQEKLFDIRRRAARKEHEERIANEIRKHELLTERDREALAEAESLGLLARPKAILATPIGGSLTPAEERWNEREKKEVERLFQSNRQQLAEFINGAKIREWEINNKKEDFELEWRKKEELHALNAEQQYFNLLAFSGGSPQNQQELARKLSEISKQTRLINIKYNKLRKQNRITRNQERKKLREVQ
ncbi:MAG: hypothetical protein Kow006_08570 [Gammaproteobacteria bacterium]